MREGRNLGAFVGRTCASDKPVIIATTADGAETITTHGDLDAMANAFARGLARAGVLRGQHVVILAANRAEFVACLLGAMRAGVVATPINFKFAAPTIALILAETAAKLIFCDERRRRDVAPLVSTQTLVGFDDPGPAGFRAWLDPGAFVAVAPSPDEAALCLYTSGSTGRPKGVLLSHASHLWVVETRMTENDIADERLLIAAPLYHMNALALMLLVFASGATAVLMPQFEAARYIAAIGHYRCTWLTAVPPMIAMMLQEKAALETADLSSVRTLRMGSAPVNDTLAAQTRALLPNARIINAYGTTEGGPIVFTAHPAGLALPSGAVGVPHPGVAVRLVGPEAPGLGVLQLKSPANMLGYLNRPELASPITSGRLLQHRRRLPARRRRFFLLCRPYRRHVRIRWRKHLSRRSRGRAGNAPGCPASLRRASRRRHKGHEARGLCRPPSGRISRRRGVEAVRAGQRAGLPAPASRLVPRQDAACRHQ